MTRIIVVDDDSDICDLVCHRMATMHMDVEAYVDGQSGLDAIVADPPDLAIIDWMMPKLNGLEVTAALRANPATKDLPIIIFTAVDRPDAREAVRQAGTEHYVIKPFSVLALGAYVEKVLGLRSCVDCGKQRGVDDIDFAPEQLLQRTQVGWVVGVNGDMCGECHVKRVAEANSRAAAPQQRW